MLANLAGAELAIISFLILEPAAGNGLPAPIRKVMDFAPDSFDDIGLGKIAALCRARSDASLPFDAAHLLPLIHPDSKRAFDLAISENPIPPALAEMEAQTVLEGYQVRLTRSVLSDARITFERSPDKSADIMASVAKTLKSMLPGQTTKPDDWGALAVDAHETMSKVLPDPVEMIAGLVCEHSKLIVGGSSKTYKTWFLLDAGLSLSSGAIFLGRPCRPCRVLHINLELKQSTLERRIQTIVHAKGIKLDYKQFLHLSLRGKLSGLRVAGIVDRIIQAALEINAAVVVLDPVYKLNVEGDENSSRDQTLLFNQLDRITTEARATLLMADHFSKGSQSEKDPLDAIRGSSAKGGDIDAAVILRKHNQEGCFSVDVVHRELPPVEPFVVAWKFPLFNLADDLNPADMKKAGGRPQKHDPCSFLQLFPDHPVSISELAMLAAVPRRTLADYLEILRGRGYVATIGEGNSARQMLTEKGISFVSGNPK